jgi:hypothetical protein
MYRFGLFQGDLALCRFSLSPSRNIVATRHLDRRSSPSAVVITISAPHGTKASKREYDRLVGEWIASGRQGGAGGEQSDLTITELVARYKKFAEGYYKGGTLSNVATACRVMRILRIRYGSTMAAEFGPLALKALRQQFVDDKAARTFVNRLVALIRGSFKWAASEQLVPTATWQSLTTVAGLRQGHTDAHETKPVEPVDEATVDATLPCLSATVADMVRLQRLTGMRPDEVCKLRCAKVRQAG